MSVSYIRGINNALSSHNLHIANLTSVSERNSGKEAEYGLFYWTRNPSEAIQGAVEEENDGSVITDYVAAVIAVVLSGKSVVDEFESRGIPVFNHEWITLAQNAVEERGKVTPEEIHQIRENIIRKISSVIEAGNYDEVARKSGKSAENLLTYCTLDLGDRLSEAFEIVLESLRESRRKGNGISVMMSGGSVFHISSRSGSTPPPTLERVTRWEKAPVIQQTHQERDRRHRIVRPQPAETPATTPDSGIEPAAISALQTNVVTEADSITIPPAADVSREDLPRPEVDALEGRTLTPQVPEEKPKTKKEMTQDSYPDLFDKDPEFIEHIEASITEMLRQFPSLSTDATERINAKQVTAAGNVRIAFANKLAGARYIDIQGSKSKPTYKPESLIVINYLKSFFPDLNFSPAAKRQLIDYAEAKIRELIRTQERNQS
jgi:hypothetical protein